LSVQNARRLAAKFVDHYNQVRLHSAHDYITPADELVAKQQGIFAASALC
jgi:putative transposase